MGSLANAFPYPNTHSTNLQMTFALNQLFQQNNASFATFTRVLLYPTFTHQFNNDSDKPLLSNPLLK
jgi:hypothetical protein